MPITKILLSLSIFASALMQGEVASAEVFELRTYTTNEGKLDDLNARFRDHTVKLFEKHGIRSLGYWVPTDEKKSRNTLIYIIAHKDRAAAKASWKAFLSDPDWKAAHEASEANGPILAKAPESVYMNATDYSKGVSKGESDDDAVYELRIYKTAEGKLVPLDARFRDHTIKLFDQHGIQSVGYWHPADQPAASSTLIYLVRHKTRDGAKVAWQSFSKDPNWQNVAKESQKNHGRLLSERPTSIYMVPTNYSAMQ
ncbi:NIPSNAP family protein [Planctomycetes bacterium K23_9]|uniref:NIPSNAP domain-containing protein n=1 Tax=Stieleria marina TaxID=1930275 RepID=A0A517P380_9BACT|nr:hypothetical protein K239x_58430 [Planctomycetes bacterium K23_9]